jgi:ribonuclease VapC
MVIDSSALIAILRAEPEGRRLQQRIREGFPRLIGAPTAAEASIVMLARFGEAGLADLGAYLEAAEIETAPLAPEHVALAVDAFRRFGRGRHEAGLNFGDCLSYAVAKATGQPLLFKGYDFARTDIQSAA